jgi:hypothetical protein
LDTHQYAPKNEKYVAMYDKLCKKRVRTIRVPLLPKLNYTKRIIPAFNLLEPLALPSRLRRSLLDQ